MTFIAIRCPHCQSDQIVKRGKTARGTQRYRCQNTRCPKGSFLLDYCNRGCLPEVKQTIIDMSLNASGVRDTARSLHICPNTVLRELKKKEGMLEAVNTTLLRTLHPAEVAWDLGGAGEARAEMMRCGRLSGTKATRVGSGMPSITTPARSWPTSLAAAQTRSFCGSKRCWSPSG